MQLKLRAIKLRSKVRQAQALDRKQAAITPQNRKLYADWQSGALLKELEEVTLQHGYGKLPSSGDMLQVPGFPRRNQQ